MASVKLTERYVASVAANPGQRLELFDQQTPGLVLRVTDQGRKTWVVRYRTLDGRQPRLTLGTYPSLGLARARENAGRIIGEARAGGDPAAEKRRARQAAALEPLRTFGDLAERYFDACVSGEYRPRGKLKRASTIAGEKGLLRTHVTPVLGDDRLETIKRETIRALLRSVRANGSKVSANRVLALVRQIFNFAVSEGRLPASPVLGISPPAAEVPRTRTLTDDELRRLWAGLAKPYGLHRRTPAGGQPVHISQPVVIALKLSLLLLQRRSEIAGMRLDELDLDQGVWIIPGDRTKNGSIHLVPLPPEAVGLIREAMKITRSRGARSAYVFPSPWDAAKPITAGAMTYALRNLYQALGIEGATLHDLRRTGATIMASERLGITPLIVSKVLAHRSDFGGGAAVTAQHYNVHTYAKEKRGALAAWIGLLEEIVGESTSARIAERELVSA